MEEMAAKGQGGVEHEQLGSALVKVQVSARPLVVHGVIALS